jgi:hypothetical protein
MGTFKSEKEKDGVILLSVSKGQWENPKKNYFLFKRFVEYSYFYENDSFSEPFQEKSWKKDEPPRENGFPGFFPPPV